MSMKKFDNQLVEDLGLTYYNSTSAIEKEKILKTLFTLYKPLIASYCFTYGKVCPIVDSEDIANLVKQGIWSGLTKFRPGNSVRYHIFYQIKHVVSKEFQVHMSDNTSTIDSQSGPLPETDVEDVHKLEDSWILRHDIEQAIDKLPPTIRAIAKLWSVDTHYLEICKQVNLKDAQVYNYIKDGKALIRKYLSVYKDEI